MVYRIDDGELRQAQPGSSLVAQHLSYMILDLEEPILFKRKTTIEDHLPLRTAYHAMKDAGRQQHRIRV
jgi:hypothetical protein